MNPFKKKPNSHDAVILDTCALIDGRIIDIARAGFVPSHIIVPQFVIAELQFLADKGDSYKRERARYGLDVARNLQDLPRNIISIAREQYPEIKEVDDKLLALAKERGAMLYTTDYNLNKVAQIEGIMVLNVNELAQALRPNRLPGERLEIKITQVGQDKTQGVGYLDDGTMVVVEKASNKLGQRVVVEFSRMLQTQAGKMMFATLPKAKNGTHSNNFNNSAHAATEQKAKHHQSSKHIHVGRNDTQPGNQPQQQNTPKPQEPKQQQPDQRQKQHSAKSPRQHTSKQASNSNANSQPASRSRRNKRRTPEDALLDALQRQDN